MKTKEEVLMKYPDLKYSVYLKLKQKDFADTMIARIYDIKLSTLKRFIKNHQDVLGKREQ